MKLSIESKGDFSDTTNWLKEASNKTPRESLNAIGRLGVNALRSATPRIDTGKTAASWDYVIETNYGGATIHWTNSNTNGSYNNAKAMQYGHGTKNGGYVPGTDYINPALDQIFKDASDRIAREVMK